MATWSIPGTGRLAAAAAAAAAAIAAAAAQRSMAGPKELIGTGVTKSAAIAHQNLRKQV